MNTPLKPRRKARWIVGLCCVLNLPFLVGNWLYPPHGWLGTLAAATGGASFLFGAWVFVRWNRPGLFRPFDWRRIR